MTKSFDRRAYENAWRRYEKTYLVSDRVLYDMCKTYPDHSVFTHVVAKVGVINAIYRTNLHYRTSLIDLEEYVYSKRKIVDAIIGELRKMQTPLDDDVLISSVQSVVDLHGRLVSIIGEFTGTEESSFVSKYMHFHRRDVVPILDRNAWKAIQSHPPSAELFDEPRNANHRYYEFCSRFLALWSAALKFDTDRADIVKKLDQYLYQSGGSIEGKYR